MGGKQTTTTSGGAASSRPLRAIGYLRVSTGGQAENGASLPSQREAVRAFAREHGYELLEVVSETKSGAVQEGEVFSHEHRPALQAIVARAERGEFDSLIVRDFDRLSRDKLTFAYLIRLLAQRGVEVVSVAGERSQADSDEGELLRGIMGELADYERRKILRRMREGKAQKKRQGRHVHGSIPFGYVSTGKGGLLEVDAELAPVVRGIFAQVRSGESPGAIARGLEDRGVPSPKRGRWSRQAVTLIVRNPVYAGERYGVKGAQPAIVSRRLWNAANAALSSRARSRNGTTT